MNVTPQNKLLATTRIAQVCRLFGQGLVVKEVAQQLDISANTVMSYVRRIQKQQNLSDLHRVYVWCIEQEVRRQTRPRPEKTPSKPTLPINIEATQAAYAH